MSGGRKGIAALLSIAVLLLTLMAIMAAASMIARRAGLAGSSEKELAEAVEEGVRGLKVLLTPGIPPGWSPRLWVVIHQLAGVPTVVDALLLERGGEARLLEAPSITLGAGECIYFEGYRYGLPEFYGEAEDAALIAHSSSGEVARALPSEARADEAYPCRGITSLRGNATLEVAAEYSNGTACAYCTDPPPGNYSAPLYTVFTLKALEDGFLYWDVSGWRYANATLPLWVDSNYTVTAVFS